jgi:polyisoprenyl-phosphate glycosyltransferase
MRKKKAVLAIVVPCYNEQENLEKTAERLAEELAGLIKSNRVDPESYLLFIDDGSKDKTWDIIRRLNSIKTPIRGVKLSRNFGHQNALLAGLHYVKDKCDAAVTIDADLQQDEKSLADFIDKYNEGYDIVFGVRKDRKADSFFKKTSAGFFYSLMKLMGADIIRNHADYRLASQKVLNALSGYRETNLFLRGVFTSIGFRSAIVFHNVKKRPAGKTKYSLVKMFRFAFNGITSFSVRPIRFITALGFLVFFTSLCMGLYVFYAYIFSNVVHGWASTLIPIYFIGGIQLLSLGVIGEYIGRIYGEVKRRPGFIIEEEFCVQQSSASREKTLQQFSQTS